VRFSLLYRIPEKVNEGTSFFVLSTLEIDVIPFQLSVQKGFLSAGSLLVTDGNDVP
jgi:hypothetical protein